MLKLGVSYYGNRIPWRVREDLKVIREAGCNYIVLTFSEEDVEFYQGAFQEIVKACHEEGLEVWMDPWAVGQAFGGETYSSLVAKNLAVRQVNTHGESLAIACPNHPAFRDYLLKWIQAAKKAGADVLFWDEPHFMIYPEPDAQYPAKLWACCCGVCQALFERKTGQEMPQLLTPEVRLFKEDCLVATTRFLCEATVENGMKASVCLLPFENSSTVNDWSKIASLPALWSIGTDPYWRPHQSDVEQFVGRFARRIKELADRYRKEPHLWILNFKIPKGEERTIRTAIETGYQAGIRNFAAWSYYGASYISIRAEDPQAVWKTLTECYQELLKRPS
ncbi:MAG: hypothetical protein NC910_03770 [Candidatus Omnitrophica bacterium]|nr:hypothetical protein [Candidatus Omnitrophota bacterium]